MDSPDKLSQNETARAAERYSTLDEADKRILTYRITYPGITDSEIGALVGLSRQNVNKRRKAPRFKKAYDSYVMEPLELLKESLKEAARVLVKSLKSKNERIAFDAACRILQSEGILKRELDPMTVKMSASFAVINRPDGSKTVLESRFIPCEQIDGKSSINTD